MIHFEHILSKCSLWDALHFVLLWHACLSSSWCPNHRLKSAMCLKLLIAVILLHACGDDNFVHVYPNGAYDMHKCSLWSALHDSCSSIHVRCHLAMLISVAKVHLAVKCWNLLWDADFTCSLLLMCLSSCHMSRYFRSTIIWSLLWCI